MNKLMSALLCVVLSLGLASVASAAGRDSGAGGAMGVNEPGSDSCGLGWQVTRKKSFIATTTRGTTNYVIPSTFGMTSGTMGCDQHDFAKRDMEAVKFAKANYEPLMIELAQGQGEFTAGLSTVMGCSDQAKFSAHIKANYSAVVNASSGEALYDTVRALGCGA